MRGRQMNPAFFQKQSDATAFNNVQQNRNNIKIKYKNARKQGTLNLSSCQPPLTEIPKEVLALDAFLEDDEKFWEVEPLRIVDFSFNALSGIPAEVANLTDCHTMKLRDNQIMSLPEALFRECKMLRILDCGSNMLTSLPDCVQECRDLRELSLNANRLSVIPEGLFALTGLHKLDVQSNQLSSFCPRNSPLFFPNMVSLNLSHNRLTAFPADLSSLTLLETLDCQDNLFTSFPSLVALRSLRSLDLSQNKMRDFPQLPQPSALARCVLSYNHLTAIPEVVFVHQLQLSELLLHNNSLVALPAQMEYLQALKVLDVSNNNLPDLPAALGYIGPLQILKTEGNPIRTIRQTLLVKNAQEVKNYLRTRGPSILAAGAGPASTASSKTARGIGGGGGDELTHRVRDMTTQLLDLTRLRLSSLESPDVFEQLQLMASNVLANSPLALLDLSQNDLTSFPLQVMECLRVKKVSFAHNALSRGPLGQVSSRLHPREVVSDLGPFFGLASCSQLVSIDVSHNGLTHDMLSALLSFCAQITELTATHNPLQRLPTAVQQCTRLQKLNVSFCQLVDVTALSFRQLSLLDSVDVSNNRLTVFSEEQNHLQCAQQLSLLNLENNDLRDVPLALGKLERLQTLLIHGNPQKGIRSFVVAQGSGAVLQALRSKAQDYVLAPVEEDWRAAAEPAPSARAVAGREAYAAGRTGAGAGSGRYLPPQAPDSAHYTAPQEPHSSRVAAPSPIYAERGLDTASREAYGRVQRGADPFGRDVIGRGSASAAQTGGSLPGRDPPGKGSYSRDLVHGREAERHSWHDRDQDSAASRYAAASSSRRADEASAAARTTPQSMSLADSLARRREIAGTGDPREVHRADALARVNARRLAER